MQYIGDAKSGIYVGKDQYVGTFGVFLSRLHNRRFAGLGTGILKTGTKKRRFQANISVVSLAFEDGTDCQSFIGRHRWVDFAQARMTLSPLSATRLTTTLIA
jgi:hypothetical protein